MLIFGRDFGKLIVVPQKTYYGSDTDFHGTRLDVYLEENSSEPGVLTTIYDIEPTILHDNEIISSLPKRMRFYHAKIDSKSLKAGESYRSLKNVTVVMITPYDPFGLNRMVYTIRNQCEEVPEMTYDDGAKTLFLYTKGTFGNVSIELQQLLRYLENTTLENAQNETLQAIHQMVETVKQDEEVSLAYMKIFEREEIIFNQGIAQEKANTEREKQRADAEKDRADAEKDRADAAEKEIIKLKKELQRLKDRNNP